MLRDNMKISRLMVHAQHVEEERAQRKSRYFKRARSFDEGFSKGRIEIHDKTRFKKRVQIKFLPSSLRLEMIGCLTLNLLMELMLGHQTRRLLVPNVEKVK